MTDIPWREKLADDLVARLAEVIPDGFRIEARGLAIEFVPPSGPGTVIDMSATTSEAEQFAVVIINRVQDVVMEWTTSPWPSSDRGKSEASSVIPLPTALVEDSMIRLFFGARQDPVLELPPVQLE